MLLYNNRRLLRLLLQRQGSIFFRPETLLAGLVLAGLGAAVQHSIDSGWEYAPNIEHHYGFQAVGVGVTFAIVFRTQLAWGRFWEAVTHLHMMYSKWMDAFAQFQAFAEITAKAAFEEGDRARADLLWQKQLRMKWNFALLSAFAAERLSRGDNERMKDDGFERIRSRISMRVEDERCAASLPKFVERRHFKRDSMYDAYPVFEVPSKDQQELLVRSYDHVATVMYWIVWDLADAMKHLDIAAPIQSRMYQELSNGMLGFCNCQKVADVPFPMPYAQLLGWLLIGFSCFIPVYVTIFTGSYIVGPILCFILFMSLWSLNEVAMELENPFGQDANDIPLLDFHLRFTDVLAEICHSNHHAMLSVALANVQGKGLDLSDRGCLNVKGLRVKLTRQGIGRRHPQPGHHPLRSGPACGEHAKAFARCSRPRAY
ncbi:UPF0187 protein [Symbiodinium microadriaticum]|uniref:UPF0187 protein n=1 Tax=Symbiodinium microadriaticum TaxID=2951 RepID=A0A1Q9CBE1_SYMMI|nr:UPF0187 protein [Symbiodinium microadriaticum]CAE7884618.1 unnamed protein product [Symbiodinium microadriaticum]